MTLASLPNAPRPCLLFFRPGHFAVLTGVGRLPNGHGELFYLADPSLGQRTMTADRLGALWHGEVLVVGPTAGSHASTGAP
jgi:ABC-type bacteriocin/lantibiotic exporter with double-glycine peptidase domain